MSGVSVKSPIKSPSLGEYSPAFLTDENGVQMPVLVVVQPDAAGHSGVSGPVIAAGETAQPTARQQAPLVTLPSSNGKVQVVALMSMDATGALKPLSLRGKFQSAVLTGTGSEQSVAHGLAVVPSAVIVAPYDNTAAGSTPFAFAVSEGTHDATNVKVTATSGLKFKVLAFV